MCDDILIENISIAFRRFRHAYYYGNSGIKMVFVRSKIAPVSEANLIGSSFPIILVRIMLKVINLLICSFVTFLKLNMVLLPLLLPKFHLTIGSKIEYHGYRWQNCFYFWWMMVWDRPQWLNGKNSAPIINQWSPPLIKLSFFHLADPTSILLFRNHFLKSSYHSL